MNFKAIIFLLLSVSGMSYAQDYTFDHLGIEQGMSQNQINAICQDKYGFMWFGTWDGLNRYDGYEFRTFKHRAFDTSSLSSNFITELLSDSRGNLWIGTNGGGINLYDEVNQNFRNIDFNPFDENSISNNTINEIIEDSNGRIWVGTNFGLNMFSQSNNSNLNIKTFFFKSYSRNLNFNRIVSIIETNENNFLICSPDGIINLNLEKEDDYSYNIVKLNHHKPESEEFRALFLDSSQNIWISSNKGLYNASSWSDKTLNLQKIKLSEDREYDILFINEDEDGHIWAGGTKKSLFVSIQTSDSKFLKFNQIQNEIISNSSQNELSYTNFYQSSNENILWIGTDIEGVKKLTVTGRNFENIRLASNKKEGLVNNAVFSVFESQDGSLWVGTRSGLSISQNLKQFSNYGDDFKELKPLSQLKIRAFEEDNDGNIWIGTVKGLFRINMNNTDIWNLKRAYLKEYQASYSDFSKIPSEYIYDIHLDSRNDLWIATNKGICRYIPATDSFERIEYLPHTHYDQSVFIVQHIYEDSKGILWLSTQGGLHRLDINAKGKIKFGHFFHDPEDKRTICSNKINHITETKNNEYWIATAHGLNNLSFINGKAKFDYIGLEKGLPNEYLYSIYSDQAGHLWMSTNMGIIRFNPESMEFKNFVREDGVQSNEFNLGAFHQNKKGKLMFGGIFGLTIFNPQNIIVNKHSPQVYITSIKSHGKELFNLSDLQQSDIKFDFSHQDNSFTIDFVALDYSNPRRNQYAYQLVKADKDWTYIGTKRSVNFSQLSPGKYTLLVKGSNNNGIWSEKPAEFEFAIAPPFWLKTQFYLIVAVFIAIILYMLYKNKLNTQITHVLEIEKVRQTVNEKVRRKAAADFHDEMGHYLTRINVLTEILKQRIKGSSNDIAGLAESIGEQSQKLYNGTRDFIWTINPDNNSIYELGIRLKDFGDELTMDTNIKFNVIGLDYTFKDNKLTTDYARHLVLIFKEAINNSVKHSEADLIELSFKNLGFDSMPEVQLSDNGTGIKEETSTNGNGLINMKKRARKINCQIEFLERIPNGTIIHLKPKAHADSKQKTA